MPTVDNLLDMERCASCERELASTWKFCIYCGRPFIAAKIAPLTKVRDRKPPVPSQQDHDEPRERKYDGTFWVGMAMGALGLVLIIYAAIQIYGASA